jgi:hypothetical protein
VALWGGGIWDWLDPLTPIRAVSRLQASHPDLKLVFLAGRSPNPGTPASSRTAEARQLASELGVLGHSVHFLDEWVPYAERGSLLLEADWGFSAHHEHLETRFSFRTRILDCLWAGLPFLCSDGDSMAERCRIEGLGAVVAEADADAWAREFARTVDEPSWREACAIRIRQVAARCTWSEAVRPLASFVSRPVRSHQQAMLGFPVLPGWAGLVWKASISLTSEGPRGLAARVRRKLGVSSAGRGGV